MHEEIAIAPSISPDEILLPPARQQAEADTTESLFDQFAWLYIFFRERVFRDDTELIARTLWPEGRPLPGTKVLELGCGPGFYACQLAEKFPEISVRGIDRCMRQLDRAQGKAKAARLKNCRFDYDNVLALSHADDTFDALISSRLFTVLPDRKRAVAEMYRVVRPGGRCLIAEPRYAFWASIPLLAMWLMAGVRLRNGYREPSTARVLSRHEFGGLFRTQPWRSVKTWQQGRYQYALCEKG